MSDQKEHPIDQAVRKTQVRVAYLWISLGVFTIFTRLGVLFLFHNVNTLVSILTFLNGILALILGGMHYWMTRQVRVVTSPGGITFFSPGIELRAAWEYLDKIGSRPELFGLRRYDSLVLRQPGEQKCAWWFRLLRRRPEKEIPLSLFGNWRASELGQEIMKYAPHLSG